MDKWAEQAERPLSATDTIMLSRQTPAEGASDRSRTAWFGAGLLALMIVVAGVILFTMQGGAELLRQWRLARKRRSRHQQAHRSMPYRTPYFTQRTELPSAPTVRYLPEVTDEDPDSLA